MHRSLLLLICLVGPVTAATTYFVDYDGGADANAGTSTGAAWKRHPYMTGWSGSYSHAAGDSFIFKGGVTWPSNCFRMNITTGGSGTSYDYYGVTNTWYSGGSWSRPVFDFGNIVIGTFSAGAGILMANVGNIIVDNIELKNHRLAFAPNGQQSATIQAINASSNLYVLNCELHDWDLPSSPAFGQDNSEGGIAYVGSGIQGVLMVSNCVFYQTGVAYRCGLPIYSWGTIAFNTASNVGTFYVGAGIIHDNHIHHGQALTDTANHPNAIEVQFGSSLIYNNWIHDCASTWEIIITDNLAGTRGTNVIYNNVLYNNTKYISIADSGGGAKVGARIFNNIIHSIGGTCILISDHSSGESINLLEARNNVFLTTSNPYVAGPGATVTIFDHNATNSVAMMNGFGGTEANAFVWTSGAYLDTGTNLSGYFSTDRFGVSRPQFAAWDIGAYEFNLEFIINVTGTANVGVINKVQ